MTTYRIADGPLYANAGDPRTGLKGTVALPVGTTLYGTGRIVGKGVEAKTNWQKNNGGASWFHADYLEATGDDASVERVSSVSRVTSGSADDYYEDVMDWYYSVAGQRIDVDGKWGPQCTDGAKHWAISEFKVPNAPYGNGRDVARGLSTVAGWSFVGPEQTAWAGDVVSWDEGWGWLEEYQQYFGHVAVVVRDLGDQLEVVQQNPKPMHKAVVGKNGLVGYARPPRPAASADRVAPEYIVESGDTFYAVARKTGISVPDLRRLNSDIVPENMIVGTKIRLS